MEKELLALFALHTVGVAVFGRFESETPWWRLVMKWTIILGLIWWISTAFGQAAALYVILAMTFLGVGFHFIWCRKNGIHPVTATPRKKYYELRGWTWKE